MFISEIPDEGDYDTCDGYNYVNSAVKEINGLKVTQQKLNICHEVLEEYLYSLTILGRYKEAEKFNEVIYILPDSIYDFYNNLMGGEDEYIPKT